MSLRDQRPALHRGNDRQIPRPADHFLLRDPVPDRDRPSQQILCGADPRASKLFLLRDGGVYPLVFWLGQIVIGSLAPLRLARFHGARSGRRTPEPGARLAPCSLSAGWRNCTSIIIGGAGLSAEHFSGLRRVQLVFRRRDQCLYAERAGNPAWDQRHVHRHADRRAGLPAAAIPAGSARQDRRRPAMTRFFVSAASSPRARRRFRSAWRRPSRREA